MVVQAPTINKLSKLRIGSPNAIALCEFFI